ncbi:SBBP repeat-containing protein [Lamprobacter modestohalophilus]|nr:SBBP repeat-containing protein [Lamprobacter modestohalophilus]
MFLSRDIFMLASRYFGSVFASVTLLLLLQLSPAKGVFAAAGFEPSPTAPPADQVSSEQLQAVEQIFFVPNVGQWDRSERFKAVSLGGTVATFGAADVKLRQPRDVGGRTLSLKPLMPNTDTQLEPLDKNLTKLNLLRGAGLSRSWSNIPTFGSVRYQQIYPGVDMVFLSRGGQLAYDLYLAPGSSPTDLRFAVEGVRSLDIDPSGALVMSFGDGDQVRQEAPLIYQLVAGERQVIDGGFRLLEQDAAGALVYGFEVAEYDPTQTLVIDPSFTLRTTPTNQEKPTLMFSRIVGGEDDDVVNAFVLDAEGNAFVAGMTDSELFPSDASGRIINPVPIEPPPENPVGSPADGFIYKIDKNGNLVFVTVLSGSDDDSIEDLAIDAEGYLYVTGSTSSEDFATMETALYPVLSGRQNAFLAKLTPDGSRLVFSTYFGGTGSESGNAIALGEGGDVVIAGTTTSRDLIVRGALQDELAGGVDGFIARFDGDGTALEYSTYFGDNGTDNLNFLVVTDLGDIFVAGNTSSSRFPVKHPPLDQDGEPLARGGGTDMFLSRISRSGDELAFSTYIGGSSTDELNDLVRDNDGNFLLVGTSASTNFPVVNAWQPEPAGGDDGVLVKIDDSGRFIYFSTYLGGLEDDNIFAVAADRSTAAAGASQHSQFIYVGGQTESHFMPVQNAYQNFHAGNGDGYLARFDPCGQQLWFSSYFGGREADSITALATGPLTDAADDTRQGLWISGLTELEEGDITPLFPLLPTGQVFPGGVDTFVALMDEIQSTRDSNYPELIIGCNPVPFVPERIGIDGRFGQVTLSLNDPGNVGISALSTTVFFDPSELQFQTIHWNPELPASANLQLDRTVPGQLGIDIYQPIGVVDFAPLTGLLGTLEFAAVQVGTVNDNPPLPSHLIRLTQGGLAAADISGQGTQIDGMPGAMVIERRCNNIIGDCDCSGQVRLFEIQTAVDYFTRWLPEHQPICVKRDYSTMRATDLQETINNYDDRIVEQDLLDAAAERRNSTRSGGTRAVVAATSQLNFANIEYDAVAGSVAFDLKLETNGQAISVLATDIYYDPEQITGIEAVPGRGTQNANKQIAFETLRPGWFRITFYGINSTTFPSDVMASLTATLAPGVSCADLQNVVQVPSAATPAAEAVPIESNSILSCNPISDAPNRSSLPWQVTELYVAILQFAPDQEGLVFWADQLRNGSGLTRAELARAIYSSDVGRALYEALSNEAFVSDIFMRLFSRAPNEAELVFWTWQLDSGSIARGDAIPTIIDVGYANPSMVQDMRQVTHMVQVGLAFAARQGDLGILFSQLSESSRQDLRSAGRVVLQGVTSDPVTRDFAIQSLPTLLPAVVTDQ